MQEATGSAVTVYTWDGEDRLLSVAAPGETQVYAYAGDGKRRKKTVGGAVTWFVWDGENVLLEADGLLAEAARYTDNPGYWGGLVSGRRSGATRYFAFDPQGSTRRLLDGSGGVTDTYGYTAFGVEQYATGATGNPYRYEGSVGYYRDGAERLYVRARYLQVGTGRWISRDPLWLLIPGQVHPCFDSPNPPQGDPTGLQGSNRAGWSPYGYAFASPTLTQGPAGKIAIPWPVIGCVALPWCRGCGLQRLRL